MTYTPTNWKDRIVEKPRTYTMQQNTDGTITLVPAPGNIIEEGTPVNAANLNKIENGIVDLYSLTAELTPKTDFNAHTANFNAHTANKTNPHSVTKTQVGLGSVQDYGIATQAEAEAGASNAKYMTPLRVKEAISEQVISFGEFTIPEGINLLQGQYVKVYEMTLPYSPKIFILNGVWCYQGSTRIKVGAVRVNVRASWSNWSMYATVVGPKITFECMESEGGNEWLTKDTNVRKWTVIGRW